LDAITAKYGTSDSVEPLRHEHSFILPDGKLVHLEGMAHNEAIAANGGGGSHAGNGYDNRPEFINKSGAVRAHGYENRSGHNLTFSVPKDGVTAEQADTMNRAASQGYLRNGTLNVERADLKAETKDQLSKQKSFPRAGDVHQMLRDIGAHPEQAVEKSNLAKSATQQQIAAHEENGGTGEAPAVESPYEEAQRPERVAEIRSRMQANLRAGKNQYEGLNTTDKNIMSWDAQNSMDRVRNAIDEGGAEFAGGPLADGRWNVRDPKTGGYATVDANITPEKVRAAIANIEPGNQIQGKDYSWNPPTNRLPENVEKSNLAKDAAHHENDLEWQEKYGPHAAQLAAHEANGGSTFSPEGENLAGKDLHSVAANPENERSALTKEPSAQMKSAQEDYNKEKDFAGRVLKGDAKVEDFPYFDSYKSTIDNEAKLLPKGGKVLFIGSGPVPASSILFDRAGFHTDSLELDPETAKIGENVARKSGMQNGKFMAGDARNLTPEQLKDYDGVVVALEAGPEDASKNQVLNRVMQNIKPGTKVLARGTAGTGGGEFVDVGKNLPQGVRSTGSVDTFDGYGKTHVLEKGDWADTAAQQAANQGGGFTIDPKTGKAPTDGYMVELFPERRVTLDHPATAEDIRNFAEKNKDVLAAHPELHVGGYDNELNIAGRFGDLHEATRAAKNLDQISAWDVKNGKEVPMGGKNRGGAFPDYKVQDRLSDLENSHEDMGGKFAGLSTEEHPEYEDMEHLVKPAEKGVISTRLPSGKKATENPLTDTLTIGRDSIDKVPGLAEKVAGKIKKYTGIALPAGKLSAGEVLDHFTNHVKENLKDLYNQVDPEKREANAKWYDSANKLANDLADKHDVTEEQASGTIAAMSPQKDWDQNVSLAKRVTDIWNNQSSTRMTPEMEAKGKELGKNRNSKGELTNPQMKGLVKKITGKTLGELTDMTQKAAWVRLFDEAHNPREFQHIDPGTGNEIGVVKTDAGVPRKVAWGSLNEISKALSILEDGSHENISGQLGEAHKVRNFYNNILDPNNPAGHVTIDTHAVAAGMQKPLSGKSLEVKDNFGGIGSKQTGAKGLYALYADAYRQAAQELGIQPRQLQSVVWEKVREQFPDEFKRAGGETTHPEAIEDLWKQYDEGKATLAETRDAVRNYAKNAVEKMAGNKATPKAEGEMPKISTKAKGAMHALDFISALRGGK